MYQQNINHSGPRPIFHYTKWDGPASTLILHDNNTITTPLRSGCWLHSTGVLNISHFWVMKVHIINTNPKKKLTEKNQNQIFTHGDKNFCNLCILSL